MKPIRLSKIFLPQVSKDALLEKSGYIAKNTAGTFSFLPLGLIVKEKIKKIIRKHLYIIGANEISLPTLSRSQLWIKTNRWDNSELYKLSSDLNNNKNQYDFCLAPTHEEEITNLVANQVNSWKQLPLLLFQITRKYRNEKRPRAGLLRAREFLMKDLYSFDIDQSHAMISYENVLSAYKSIFTELGVPFIIANADSGSIGGDLSHEIHYLSEHGEDLIAICSECDYAANIEKATSVSASVSDSVSDSVSNSYANVQYFVTKDRSTLVAAYTTLKRNINNSLVKNEIPEIDEQINNSDIAISTFKSSNKQSFNSRLIMLLDSHLPSRPLLPDLPVEMFKSNITKLTDLNISQVKNGDKCIQCSKGIIHLHPAIEVGHTFYLGTKYTKPLDCKVSVPKKYLTNYNYYNHSKENDIKDNEVLPMEMGCYGIGVSRLLAAISLKRSDSHGLVWPVSISPFDAIIVCANGKKNKFKENINNEDCKIEEIINSLRDGGINAIWDDRESYSFGYKMNDALLLGVPLTIVLGKKFFDNGKIEIQERILGKDSKVSIVDNIEEGVIMCRMILEKRARSEKDEAQFFYKKI